MLVDAVDTKSVKHVKRSHPLRVTFGQIVIDRHYVHTIAGQGVEENGQRGHKCLSLTRSHLGDFALMQYDATKELYVIVYHVPFCVVAAGNPMVLVDSLVALDADEIVGGGKFAVEVVGRHFYLGIFGEAARSFFYNGEDFGLHLVEGVLEAFEHFFLDFIDLVEDQFSVFDGSFFDFPFQRGDFLLQVVGRMLHFLLQLLGLGAQGVVVQGLNGRVNCFDLVHERLNQLHVATGLVAKEFAQDFIDIHIRLILFQLGIR